VVNQNNKIMAAAIIGNAMGPFLELWGIDTKRLIEATIHIVMDDMVIVNVRYAASVDKEEMEEELKRYALVEFKNE